MAGKSRCRHLVVGITNPDPSLTGEEVSDPHRSDEFANPLTYFERCVMVRAALSAEGVSADELVVVPFPINFPKLFKYYVPMDAKFFLTIYDEWGREKLNRFRSLGLEVEVLWERSPAEKGITGKEVRSGIVAGDAWETLVPESTRHLVQEWGVPDRLRRLLEREDREMGRTVTAE